MKITESRASDILHWLDDETGNHALLFEQMALHRDAAALIRQLQAAEQAAWLAGMDAGREQGKGNEHCRAEPQPLGVEAAVRAFWRGYNAVSIGAGGRRQGRTAAGVVAVLALTQQPAAVDDAWRQKAAEWLEAKAVEQEANNQRWSDHAAAYKEWRDRPSLLRMLAAQVLAAQQGGSDNDR